MHQIAQDSLLRVEGLSKVFRSGEAELVLFENLSFQVRKGTMLAIVGQSGAGKSTLLRLATGQLRPDLGRVRVFGLDAWTAAAKRHVGYCPEIDAFYEEMSEHSPILRWQCSSIFLYGFPPLVFF